MTLPNPKFAPRRTDLPWLRHRKKPRSATTTPTAAPPRRTAASAPSPAASSGPPRQGGKIDYTRRDRTPAAASPPPPAPGPTLPAPTPPAPTPREATPAAASTALDLGGPHASTPHASTPPASTPPRATPSSTSSSSSTSLDLSSPSAAPPGGGASLDLGSPAPAPASSPGGASLDLGTPSPAPSTGPSTSLDLGAPPPPPPTSAGGTSLDLGGGASPPATNSPATGSPAAGATPPPRPTAARGPGPRPARHHVTRRVARGSATLLEFSAPVVTLDRIQSGVGQLTIDAVIGDDVGDLHIGAAYGLTDGRTGTVELQADRRHGPEGRRPIVWAGREGRFERISLDLRQSRHLARVMVYGFSPSRAQIRWGGTMIVTTAGGDRIDAPIVSAPSPAVVALLTLYNVDGELVLRSEMDPIAGSVRDTCRAFGYDRITWLDDRTPVT